MSTNPSETPKAKRTYEVRRVHPEWRHPELPPDKRNGHGREPLPLSEEDMPKIAKAQNLPWTSESRTHFMMYNTKDNAGIPCSPPYRFVEELAAYLAGSDESIMYGRTDFDIWLRLCRRGYGGFTMPFPAGYHDSSNHRRDERLEIMVDRFTVGLLDIYDYE